MCVCVCVCVCVLCTWIYLIWCNKVCVCMSMLILSDSSWLLSRRWQCLSALTATDKYLLRSLKSHSQSVRFGMSAELTGFVDSSASAPPPGSLPPPSFLSTVVVHTVAFCLGYTGVVLPFKDLTDSPSCCYVGKRQHTHTHTHAHRVGVGVFSVCL